MEPNGIDLLFALLWVTVIFFSNDVLGLLVGCIFLYFLEWVTRR